MKFCWLSIIVGSALNASLVMAQTEPNIEFEIDHFWRNECATCHGQQGEGVELLLSPALAGLPDYYVVQQVEKFRRGIRTQPDGENLIVAEMHSEAVELDEELYRKLGMLIANLPVRRPPQTVLGDAAEGEQPYQQLCAECHGSKAEGNPARQAPPLYGFQDWYLVEQIRKFRLGRRHADTAQIESIEMHAMALRFEDMQDMRDIAVYINSQLEGKPDADP